MMATIGKPKTRAQNIRPHTVKPRFTDTRLIRTSHYCGQFALSLGKESPYIFTMKFQLTLIYNTDTFYAPLGVRIIGVSPYSCHTQFFLPPALLGATWEEGL